MPDAIDPSPGSSTTEPPDRLKEGLDDLSGVLNWLFDTRVGHGVLALLVGIVTTLITWGLASAFTQVDEFLTSTVDITLYIVAGGIWAFLLLWAVRPR